GGRAGSARAAMAAPGNGWSWAGLKGLLTDGARDQLFGPHVDPAIGRGLRRFWRGAIGRVPGDINDVVQGIDDLPGSECGLVEDKGRSRQERLVYHVGHTSVRKN